jgi:non-lysosomal glucosylceramidase
MKINTNIIKENNSYSNLKKTYSVNANQTAFLLGGIGTGNISIGSRGNLKDIEIFNRPNKGQDPPFTFFSIWAAQEGKTPIIKKLEAKIPPPYPGGSGLLPHQVAGIPHLDSSTMIAEYPFVWIDFKDKDLQLKVSLEAFTPFIPLSADDSGIPGIILRYKVVNITKKKVKVSIAGSMANMLGNDKYHKHEFFTGSDSKLENKLIKEKRLKGIYYTASDISKDSLQFGNMTLATTENNITSKPNWLQSGGVDGIEDFWEDFYDDGNLEDISGTNALKSDITLSSPKVGSIASACTLHPGQEKTIQFIISWYFPNRLRGWEQCDCSGSSNNSQGIIKNYYATKYIDSWDVAKYLVNNLDILENDSRNFHRALFSSTLPTCVLDAISANITVLRSPTCFRIENGTFLGWEGCCDSEGCCPGSCTHVWNYAQTVAFLFPELEQSMRKIEFGLETDINGYMHFRTIKAFGIDEWNNDLWEEMPPAADGQLGSIIRLYREWKISGNSKLIENLWPKVKLALDYAIKNWDTDNDYVLDSKKHNTYDIEFYGPEPLSNSLFYAALKAASLIAEHLEDLKVKEKYQKALEIGSRNMDKMLWNGEFYIQKIDDINKYKYQFGKGCLSDQLFGQTLAHLYGLGDILPKEHVKKAIKSVYDNNFKTNLSDHHNLQRTYALGDEAGLLLCTWPKGGRPRLPFIYSDEVWTGIEYQVATHLIYEGYIDEALSMIKAVRDRYDGHKRNPFDEVECGHHYVRSMASWGLLIALSGFKYNMVEGEISFDPRVNADSFSCFFSTGKGWGIYKQRKDKSGSLICNIEVLYGSLEGIKIKNNEDLK